MGGQVTYSKVDIDAKDAATLAARADRTLSNLTNAATARTNLGLGALATLGTSPTLNNITLTFAATVGTALTVLDPTFGLGGVVIQDSTLTLAGGVVGLNPADPSVFALGLKVGGAGVGGDTPGMVFDTQGDTAVTDYRTVQFRNLTVNTFGWELADGEAHTFGNADTHHRWAGDTKTDNSGEVYEHAAVVIFHKIEGDGSRLRNTQNRPWVSGLYYSQGRYISDFAATTGVVFYAPLFIPAGTSINQIWVNVRTAAGVGSTARLGIYADANGLPGSLVLDGGDVAIDSTGTKTATIAHTAVGGNYWLALKVSAAASFQGYQTLDTWVHGVTSPQQSGGWALVYSHAASYGAYAANASSVTITTNSVGPQIGLRAA